jgi:CHRD domain
MRRLLVGFAAAALTLALMGIAASAAAPPRSTFVVVLNAQDEVPQCGAATNASRGVAIFRVTNETTGTVEWRLIANNIPGNTTAAHIHLAPAGSPGPVVQPLAFTPGQEGGVIGEGSFTNPTVLAAIRANPSAYYVNVHSNVCPTGVVRGQFE